MMLLLIALLIPLTAAHMHMKVPCSRNSPDCKQPFKPDFDIDSPLIYEPEPELGGPFPCKGHTQQGPPTWHANAGNAIRTEFAGTANHEGGHCQFALSYDNGRTWVTIKTILHDCLAHRGNGPYSYDVPIPNTAPAGRVVLGWLFYNKQGDQEVYMNCADGQIDHGMNNGYITGPELLVLRLPGHPRLGEWMYGGDNGVGMFNRRRIVTIRAHGAARTNNSQQTQPRQQQKRTGNNQRQTINAGRTGRPQNKTQNKQRQQQQGRNQRQGQRRTFPANRGRRMRQVSSSQDDDSDA